MTGTQILVGDARARLAELEPGTVQTCVTSPPYFGLRDYDDPGQIGLEDTPDQYVDELVDVFAAVWRVLRDDGTLWLNLGDSYANGGSGPPGDRSTLMGHGHQGGGPKRHALAETRPRPGRLAATSGIKAKDLVGIPWMVAFALRAAGWYLRSEVIWSKPNGMPESVADRPTKAHETLFLLAKSPRYYYDQDAIREPHTWADDRRNDGRRHEYGPDAKHHNADTEGRQRTRMGAVQFHPLGRNKRDVWTVPVASYTGAHFAVFPPKLITPCILAGSARHAHDPDRALVLDPFAGSGTTGVVAEWHGRDFIGVELNPTCAADARRRIATEGKLGRPARRGPEPSDDQDALFEA